MKSVTAIILATGRGVGKWGVAHRDPQLQQQWAAAKDRWQLIQAYDYQPSDIVWLNLHDPRQRDPPDKAQLNRVEVYRLK